MASKLSMPTIHVKFCYALQNEAPKLFDIDVSENTSITQVLQKLNEEDFREVQYLLTLQSNWAIFGKKQSADYILKDGDRIELCRPLVADPMSARRHRARREHKSGKM
jgi:putative ubiquitin-RnfH superfamily antitoxin RatB of RatAB toxin-antitoxin module